MGRQDIDAFHNSDFAVKKLFRSANSKAFYRYPLTKPEFLSLYKIWYDSCIFFLKFYRYILSISKLR